MNRLRRFEQPVGGVGAAVQDHVLAKLAQFRIEVVIDAELARVDDAHVHPRRDGVIEEHRVHGLAHQLVAAEGEGQVRNAPRNMRVRQFRPDAARGLDEGHRVVVVLLDPGAHREDVGIEDNVLGREAHALRKQPVGALANREFALGRLGLARLVEGHDDGGRAIAQDAPRMLKEGLFAFLHADRIDDGLALHAFEARLDHRPFRAVDHHRHARNVGLRRDEMEEGGHRLLRVEKPLVHVHIEHVRAAFDLLARDAQRAIVVASLDELAELGGAGHVGPLAHHNELLARACHASTIPEMRFATHLGGQNTKFQGKFPCAPVAGVSRAPGRRNMSLSQSPSVLLEWEGRGHRHRSRTRSSRLAWASSSSPHCLQV